MKAWHDSMTVTGTVHDRNFTTMTFSSSYLYLLSKIVFYFVDQSSVHSRDANKCNITLICQFCFKNLNHSTVIYSQKEIRKISLHFTLTDDGCLSCNRLRQPNQNERDR